MRERIRKSKAHTPSFPKMMFTLRSIFIPYFFTLFFYPILVYILFVARIYVSSMYASMYASTSVLCTLLFKLNIF